MLGHPAKVAMCIKGWYEVNFSRNFKTKYRARNTLQKAGFPLHFGLTDDNTREHSHGRLTVCQAHG